MAMSTLNLNTYITYSLCIVTECTNCFMTQLIFVVVCVAPSTKATQCWPAYMESTIIRLLRGI